MPRDAHQSPITCHPADHTARLTRRPSLVAVLFALTVTLITGTGNAQAAFKQIGTIGTPGTGPEQLNEPRDVAVNDTTHDIYIADTGNNRIQELNPSESTGKQFVLMIGKEVNKTKKTNTCTRTEIETEHVECQAGQAGSNAGEADFNGPRGVAIDNSGGANNADIYISDTNNNRILVFTPLGTFITEFNGTLTPDKTFSEPRGLTIDGNGNVYVTDRRNKVIDKFSPLGTELLSPLVTTTLPNSNPTAVAVNPTAGSEAIYVANEFDDVGLYNFTTGLEEKVVDSQPFPNQAMGVALDVATGNVFVSGEETIREYTASGTLIKEFGLYPQQVTTKIAVDPEAKTHLYVALSESRAGATEDKIEVFEGGHEPPTAVTLPPPSSHPNPPPHSPTPSETIEGAVNPNGVLVAVCRFEYGANEEQVTTHKASCEQPVGEGESPVRVSTVLTGLIPNETYKYRLFAEDPEGSNTGEPEEFTTEPAPPKAEDQPPSAVATRTSAKLSGTIDPEHSATTYHFEYETSSKYEQSKAYGQKTSEASAGSGMVDVATGPSVITGLEPETTYSYRLVANNQATVEEGKPSASSEQRFTTQPRTPPLVGTGEASGITQTTANIAGTVNPRGLQTSYELELGTETAGRMVYNGPKVFGSAGQGSTTETILATLQDLAPGTEYHYRLLASNTDGTSEGADNIFTTLSYPTPITQPLTPPLLATLPIVFPAEPPTPKPPPLTCREKAKKIKNAKKRAQALKRCAKALKKKTKKKA